MIGKLIGIFVGRSMAKRRGYSGMAGAAAGLVAPILIKSIGSLAKKRGAAAIEARRERRSPKYLRRMK